MKILAIYDLSGEIISQSSGDVREPQGIPFIWVEVPENQILKKIDVSSEEHKAVFEEREQNEYQKLLQQISDINIALAELIGG